MIKVKFIEKTHSKNRGIGFYAEHLLSTLETMPNIKLVDKNPDIIHYPFFDLFIHTLPFKKKYPTIVTIHDITPLLMKNRFPSGIRGTLNLYLQKFSLTKTTGIIVDSESVKKDVEKVFGFNKDQIYVAPLAYDEIYNKRLSKEQLQRIERKYNLPPNFVLKVSAGPNANKNLPMLAEATKDLGIPLVIVGGGMTQKVDKKNYHIELADLVSLKQFDHIIFPGFVNTEDLLGIFQLCKVYCQASLYEGFGIPVVESMAVGCILVCSNTSSMPEIYPKGTITFNPHSLESMKKALEQGFSLNNEQRNLYAKKMIKRAKEFTWEKTGLLTYKAYFNALKNLR